MELICAGECTDAVMGWVVAEESATRAFWCISTTNWSSRRQSGSTWNADICQFYNLRHSL